MTTPSAHAPIGVFDSGVGGLSVLRALRQALPHETLHYVADSGHAPYGDKPPAFIQQRAEHILDFFQTQGVKAAVVACNTVTGLSISALRARFVTLPIVAIEPAVKPAVLASHTRVVGVLATHNTARSAGLARLIAQHAGTAQVLVQACPGWADRVERGELDSPATEAAVREQVQPLLAAGADTLVLGCTHYPFLAPVIRRVAGPQVQILDPAPAVARELTRRLDALGLRAPASQTGTERFWSSGALDHTPAVIGLLWGHPVQVSPL
jgi:glutamate racemase